LLPGGLVEIGPATLATGGCVANTGRALHRLGISTRLLGKIGDDPLGGIVRQELARVDAELAGDYHLRGNRVLMRRVGIHPWSPPDTAARRVSYWSAAV
jgi:sugar/nucleoside kinase (ribokinase family)